ncbi:4-coumarate--CoA ligase 2 [Escovopsis weberi]|uniref:4-coumarate--CoA ligase 2 n=1 Tax=Escovopsis weberi TaxID=150374 RepID=A0A0N0RTC3_ESCWE|nr:4-coumarate--CoA ligase 2 [Escovopsis weberi]
MLFKSVHVDVDIPIVDLWGFYMETPRVYPTDHPIFIDYKTKLSYSHSDIKQLATELGKGLRHVFNINKGDMVGLFTKNHIDVPLITLAMHWAGAVQTPANPSYTAEELARQLRDSGAKLLLTQMPHLPVALRAAALAGLPAEKVLLLGDERDTTGRHRHWTEITAKGAPVEPTRPTIDPKKDLAYLIYSSGTTGMPKGVMLTHFNMVANARQVKDFDIPTMAWDRDTHVCLLPLYHIYCLGPVTNATLQSGARSVIMPTYEIEELCKIIQEYDVTFLFSPPPVVLALSKNPVVDKYDLSSLRWVNSGAAPLGRELVHSVWKRLKVGVKNAYGLSETSPVVTCQLVDEFWKFQGSVGRFIPNMLAKIVDEEGKELGRNEVGELLVKGPNVFVGYWKLPQLQSENFTADGWYKTGDIGHVDDRGHMYISDRKKELIKYQGFQVPPAELEAKLLGREDITDVCVIGIWDEARHTEIPRAYVVLSPGVEETEAKAKEIVDWFSTQVSPPKRLRGGVRFIKEVPKSQSGKILRRVLRDKVRKEEERAKAKL